jgi:ABC-type antimicrobial peptide transport system permease subunit
VTDAPAALRRALDDVDPLLPFADIRSIDAVKGAAIAGPRFLMGVLVALAAAAVLLAAVGIHGLIATSVTERTREMGIRMALGASSGQSMRTLVAPGLAMAAAGVLIGSALSLAATGLLRSFVWGIRPNDPATFLAVAVVLLVIATVASVLPAMKILRLDPARTLRRD